VSGSMCFVAECCRVLQSVAECCSVLQCGAVCCSVLQRGAVGCSVHLKIHVFAVCTYVRMSVSLRVYVCVCVYECKSRTTRWNQWFKILYVCVFECVRVRTRTFVCVSKGGRCRRTRTQMSV